MGFSAADSAAATGDEVPMLPVVVGVVTGLFISTPVAGAGAWLGLGCIVCAVWVVIPSP